MPLLCYRRRNSKRWIIFWFIIGTLTVHVVIYILHTHQERGRTKHRLFLKTFLEKQSRSLMNSNNTDGSRPVEACVHPHIPLWTEEVRQYLEKVEPIKCTDDENWVYTKNGKFYISKTAVDTHGYIKCAYVPIVNANESFRTLKPIIPMLNGSQLSSDVFKVSCKSSKGHKYANFHAGIAPTSSGIHSDISSKDNFNVMIFGFDSLSRHMFKRLLPRTHHYFTGTLGGILLEGYNIVGDGTTQALLPLLTGNRETEIAEVRRGKNGAQHLDEVLEFVWKRYERRGYVTQWTEDMADIGTFTYRLLGFKNQPVNHYMRPFYLAAIPVYSHFPRYCLGSRPRHIVYLDWLKEGLETNKGRNFFTMGFFSEFSHTNNNPVILTDEDNVKFFKFLQDMDLLSNTFLFVMSDHGVRYGSIRMSEQGKLEERMPYFGIYVPPKFRDKYPGKYLNLTENRNRLVIPSDIHETLLDILGETSSAAENNEKRTKYSLFSVIPKERTCDDAKIEPHWCACLQSNPISVSDQNVLASVQTSISKLNELLQEVSTFCHTLSLQKIIKAKSLKTNDLVLKFKQSADADGRIADFTDNLHPELFHYQVTFETVPGNAVFEATALVNLKTGVISVNEREISRLNRYNNDPKCIEKWYPNLRPYCFCR